MCYVLCAKLLLKFLGRTKLTCHVPRELLAPNQFLYFETARNLCPSIRSRSREINLKDLFHFLLGRYNKALKKTNPTGKQWSSFFSTLNVLWSKDEQNSLFPLRPAKRLDTELRDSLSSKSKHILYWLLLTGVANSLSWSRRSNSSLDVSKIMFKYRTMSDANSKSSSWTIISDNAL